MIKIYRTKRKVATCFILILLFSIFVPSWLLLNYNFFNVNSADSISNNIGLSLNNIQKQENKNISEVLESSHTSKVVLKSSKALPLNIQEFYDKLAANYDMDLTVEVINKNKTERYKAEALKWGQTSARCTRKSMLLNFETELILGTDKYTSVVANSLCEDDAFYKYPTSLHLLSLLDLYPSPIHLVDLRLETKEHSEFPLGVYLFMHLPIETIQRYIDNDVDIMIQRANYGGKWINSKWVDNDKNDTNSHGYLWHKEGIDVNNYLPNFYNIFTATLTDDHLENVRKSVDFDRYLIWLGFNSFVQNGDFQDEIFFFNIDRNTKQPYFSFVPWDYSEIQSKCHRSMCGEFRDLILHCAESSLDKFVIYNSAVRHEYRSMLMKLIGINEQPGILSQSVIEDIALSLQTSILAILNNQLNDHPNPLISENNKSPQEVVKNIETSISKFLKDLQFRRVFLQNILSIEHTAVYAPQNLEVVSSLHLITGSPFPIDIFVQSDELRSMTLQVNIEIHPVYSDSVPTKIQYTANVYRGRGSVSIILSDTEKYKGALVEITAKSECGMWNGYRIATLNDISQRWINHLKPNQIETNLIWGPYDDVYLDGIYEFKNRVLHIRRGTNIYMKPNTSLNFVNSTLLIDGLTEDPVLFTKHPIDIINIPLRSPIHSDESSEFIQQKAGWGEIKLMDNSTSLLNYAYFIGGGDNGGNDKYNIGHSNSRAVVRMERSHWEQHHGGIIDNIGKAFGINLSHLNLCHVLVSRCDTGGEIIHSMLSYYSCHVLEIPDSRRLKRDDDNDGVYVIGLFLPEQEKPSQIRNCVFANGEDDAIDHNNAWIEVDSCWIEQFNHEGIAASVGNSITVRDSIITQCEQAAECGYGSPELIVDHCLLFNNSVGIRYGDGYDWSYNGTLQVKNTISMNNERNWRNWVYKNGMKSGRAADKSLIKVDECSVISPDDLLLTFEEYNITALPGTLWNKAYSLSSVSLHWNLNFDYKKGSIILNQNLLSEELEREMAICGGGGPQPNLPFGPRTLPAEILQYRRIFANDQTVAQCLAASLNFPESNKNITIEKLLLLRNPTGLTQELFVTNGLSNSFTLLGENAEKEKYRIDWKPFGSNNEEHHGDPYYWDQGWGEIVSWHYLRSMKYDLHHPATIIASRYSPTKCRDETCEYPFLLALMKNQKNNKFVGASSTHEPMVFSGIQTLGMEDEIDPNGGIEKTYSSKFYISAREYLTSNPSSSPLISSDQKRAYLEIYNQEIFDFLFANWDRWKAVNWFSVCTPDAYSKVKKNESSLLIKGCNVAYFDNGMSFQFWKNGSEIPFRVPSHFGCHFGRDILEVIGDSLNTPSNGHLVLRSLACDPLHYYMASYVNFYDLHMVVLLRILQLTDHINTCFQKFNYEDVV